MRLRVRMGTVLLLCGLSATTSLGQGAPPGGAVDAPQADVTVRTSLSQTALWVGDRVTYTVELACAKNVDVFMDDLSVDKLRLDGLEVVDTGVETDRRMADRVTYRFHYRLTTYRVDLPALQIYQLPVRYYLQRPGQRLEEAVPAGEVRVPGAVLAFRSAIPETQEAYSIRDSRLWTPRSFLLTLGQSIGIGLIVISIAPVTWWGVLLVRRARRPKLRRRSPRRNRAEEAALLERLRTADVSTGADRREAYARLEGLVRAHLDRFGGLAVRALTPVEIGRELPKRRPKWPLELVMTVLKECDLARYAPDDRLPPPERWQQTVQDAESFMAKAS